MSEFNFSGLQRKNATISFKGKGSGDPMKALMQKEIENLQNDLEKSATFGQKLNDKYKKLKKQNKEYKQACLEVQKELDKSNNVKKINLQLEDEVRKLKENNKLQSIQLQGLQERQDELLIKEKELKSVLSNNQDLRQRLKGREREVEKLKKERSELEEKLREKEQLSFRLASPKKKEAEDREKIRLKNSIATLNEKITDMQQKNQNLELKRKIVEQRLKKENIQLNKELEKSIEEREIIEKKIKELDPKAVQKKIVKVKQSFVNLQQTKFMFNQTKNELKELSNDMKNMERKIIFRIKEEEIQAKKNIESYKEMLENSNGANQIDLQKENKRLEKENQTLKKRIEEGKEKLRRVQFASNESTESEPLLRTINTKETETITVEKHYRSFATPLFSDKREYDIHALHYLCCGRRKDPLAFCGIENSLLQKKKGCLDILNVFVYILLFPLILVPPFAIYAWNYVAYYIKHDGCSPKSNFERIFTHQKIVNASLLTMFFYIPGIIYALVHWIILIFVSFPCFESCCGCCIGKRRISDV